LHQVHCTFNFDQHCSQTIPAASEWPGGPKDLLETRDLHDSQHLSIYTLNELPTLVADDVDAGAGAAAALVTALRCCWTGAKLEIDGATAELETPRLLQIGASALGVKGRGAATLRLHPALLAICCCCIIVAIAAKSWLWKLRRMLGKGCGHS
jgi:hypothetical protein